MADFKTQDELDAYQIAENTPKNRHAAQCRSYGVGALVTRKEFHNLCTCWVIEAARSSL